MIDTNYQSEVSEKTDTKESVSHETCNSHSLKNNLIWLTTVEAAIYLRRFTKEGLPSTSAIRTLVCRGRLRARKCLGKLYFKRTELDYLIETSELKGV